MEARLVFWYTIANHKQCVLQGSVHEQLSGSSFMQRLAPAIFQAKVHNHRKGSEKQNREGYFIAFITHSNEIPADLFLLCQLATTSVVCTWIGWTFLFLSLNSNSKSNFFLLNWLMITLIFIVPYWSDYSAFSKHKGLWSMIVQKNCALWMCYKSKMSEITSESCFLHLLLGLHPF